MSLKTKIYEYIKYQYPNWCKGVEIQRLAQNNYFGEKYYSGETASREARRLSEDLVETRRNEGLVEYRYKPQRMGVLDNLPRWTDNNQFAINNGRNQTKLI